MRFCWRAVATVMVGGALALVVAGTASAQNAADRERAIIEQQRRVLEQQRKDAEKAAAADQHRQDAVRQQQQQKAAAAQQQKEGAEIQGALESAVKQIAAGLTSPPAAKVASVSTEYTTLVGGHNAGVARGDSVRCFARGAPIVVDGEDLGFEETPIGNGTVEEVREKVALVKVAQPQATPKVGDVCYRNRVDLGKVALMPLLHQGQRTRLGENLEERLYQNLTDRGVTLVERSQLTRIIAEQKLGDSALVDEKNAAHVGALVGADALLMGTLDDLGNGILLAARVVSAKEGVILASQQVTLPKSETSVAMLERTMTPEDHVGTIAQQAAGRVTLDNPTRSAQMAVAQAETYIAAGQLKEAGDAFAVAIKLKPDLPEVKHLGKELHEAPAQDAPKLLEKADALLAAGMLDEAAEAFVAAVGLNPNLPDVKAVAARLRAAADAKDRDIRAALLRERQRAAKQKLDAGEYELADRNLAVGLALAPDDPENRAMEALMIQQPLTQRLSELVLKMFRTN